MADRRRLLVRLVVTVVVVNQAKETTPANIKVGDQVSLSFSLENKPTVLVLLLEPTDQEGNFNISQFVNLTCSAQSDREVDDVTETPIRTSDFRNCLEMQRSGYNKSGEYTIHPHLCCPNSTVSVYCDFQTDDGGWTVIQRRDQYPEQVDFFRSWKDYVEGFGKVSQEFWLGLKHIHALTSQGPYEVRFDLEDFEGVTGWAKYGHFDIGDEDLLYKLTISEYSGNASDGMKFHDGMNFSTKDKDNDGSVENCATQWLGGWWYKNCQHVSLNGPYVGPNRSPGAEAILWFPWRYFSPLKKTEMKIRPVTNDLR